MKLQTLIFSFLAISSTVFAATPVIDPIETSEEMTTQRETRETLLKNNFIRINELKDKINGIDGVLAKFEICEAKNKAYFGKNVKGGDSDDCVDIQIVPVKRNSQYPTLAGYYNYTLLGTLTVNSGDYLPGNTGESWGRMRADALCKSIHTGSRAMTYYDVKYIHQNLRMTTTGDDFWIFDAEQSKIKTDVASTKFASSFEISNCRGWSSVSSANKGLVIEVKEHDGNKYLQYNEQTCNSPAAIACVYN